MDKLLEPIFPQAGIVKLICKYAFSKSKSCTFSSCRQQRSENSTWFCEKHLCNLCLDSKLEFQRFCAHCMRKLESQEKCVY